MGTGGRTLKLGLASLTAVIPVQVVWVAGVDRRPDRPSWKYLFRFLLLGEGLDAAGAGHRVGYGDASQFTREYKRLFGAPPMRDAERLREAAATGVASP